MNLKRKHVERMAEMGCIICQGDAVLHHVMHMQGKEERRDDRFIVPLCPMHHNMGNQSVHHLGSEKLFQKVHGVDLIEWAVNQWEITRDGDA